MMDQDNFNLHLVAAVINTKLSNSTVSNLTVLIHAVEFQYFVVMGQVEQMNRSLCIMCPV